MQFMEKIGKAIQFLPKWNFQWIQLIQRIWKITEAWIGFHLIILSVTCGFLVMVSYSRYSQFEHSNIFLNHIIFVTEFSENT